MFCENLFYNFRRFFEGLRTYKIFEILGFQFCCILFMFFDGSNVLEVHATGFYKLYIGLNSVS